MWEDILTYTSESGEYFSICKESDYFIVLLIIGDSTDYIYI